LSELEIEHDSSGAPVYPGVALSLSYSSGLTIAIAVNGQAVAVNKANLGPDQNKFSSADERDRPSEINKAAKVKFVVFGFLAGAVISFLIVNEVIASA